MQSILVMFRSDGERRSFSVTREMTVIGRRADCDLQIPLGEVSRKHCRLVRDGDLLKLEDLGSANGTYLNGQRVQESLLAPGDTIQVGPVVFVLQLDGVPADDELQPVYAEGAAMAFGGNAASYSDADVHPGHPEEPVDESLEPLDEDEGVAVAPLDEPLELEELEPIEMEEHADEPAEREEESEAIEELEPLEELEPQDEETLEELSDLGSLDPEESTDKH